MLLPDNTPVLLVEKVFPSRQSNYAHLNFKAAYYMDGEVACHNRFTETGLYFPHLTICNQIDERDRGISSYAWHCEYREVYSLDLFHCEQMCKTLKTISRRYLLARGKFGNPQTYGDYVTYMAKAMKVTHLASMNRANDGMVLVPIGDYQGSDFIDTVEKQLHIECQKLAA